MLKMEGSSILDNMLFDEPESEWEMGIVPVVESSNKEQQRRFTLFPLPKRSPQLRIPKPGCIASKFLPDPQHKELQRAALPIREDWNINGNALYEHEETQCD